MGVTMKRIFFIAVVLMLLPYTVQATRIKDIASFDGVRDNQLIGYGLVVGLNGSGDSDQTKFPVQTLTNLLERSGVSIRRTDITVKNIAAVMVTATLPPLAKQGTRLDVLVSSMGDAKSLAGGTLLMTPLKGGRRPDFMLLPRAPSPPVPFPMADRPLRPRKTTLRRVGFRKARWLNGNCPMSCRIGASCGSTCIAPISPPQSRIASVINGRFQGSIATCKDPGSVVLSVPDKYQGNTVEFAAALESLQVQPDMPAKVVLNERTGTIVIGNDIRISTIAVAHGNLTLTIKETPKVSQPEPFSRGGETVVVPRTTVKVNEEKGNGLFIVKEGANIGDVVKALNAIGVTPRDLIGIMQAIKAAGALQGELEII